MKQASLPKMTVDEFLIWSERQIEGRYELYDGEIIRQSHDGVSLQAEKVIHTSIKGNTFLAFHSAIAKAKLPCRAMTDGATVRIDKKTGFEPDVLVYCGNRADPRSMEIPNPTIVVEVLSAGTATRDMRDKLVGYFTVPSIMHYLILDPDKNLVIHHARGDGEDIRTRIVSDGTIALNPPGVTIAVADLFE